MLYFAYGSNMDWKQMKDRCPSAQYIANAILRDHKLAFTRESKRRGCGVADVVPESGHNVWGVVYKICEQELGSLDKAEGYCPWRENNAYWRRECIVYIDNEAQKPKTVSAYFAEREDDPPLPNKEYKILILKGARYWNLPEKYVHELEQIKVSD